MQLSQRRFRHDQLGDHARSLLFVIRRQSQRSTLSRMVAPVLERTAVRALRHTAWSGMRLARPPTVTAAIPRRSGARSVATALPVLETREDVISAARELAKQELPLPGRGRTAERFRMFSQIAASDLALARVYEGHADAHAILAEARVAARSGLYGVWAARGAEPMVTRHDSDVARLSGLRRFCSGATGLDRALVATDDGELFDVALDQPGVHRHEGSWQAVGMATTDSLDVTFDDVIATPVGERGFYLERPGFWHGAVGVAACWYGGAQGAVEMLRSRIDERVDDHRAAHFGAVVAACEMMRRVLDSAAAEIDRSAGRVDPPGRERALLVRQLVESGCQQVLERVGRAGGTAPLVFDRAHAKRAADLVVYLRQHHAERDLAELGRLALAT